jgi:hypothetical protein
MVEAQTFTAKSVAPCDLLKAADKMFVPDERTKLWNTSVDDFHGYVAVITLSGAVPVNVVTQFETGTPPKKWTRTHAAL